MASFFASRAVALDKNPRIRPVGIGDIFRRIISSVIRKLMRDEVREVMGPIQQCVGHVCGIEATVHAMQQLYEDKETEGCLLIDAANAFNRMNRKVALRSIQVLCPKLFPFFSNTYRTPSMIFTGNGIISSEEGTTQGDSAAMCMYELGTLPLVKMPAVAKRCFYADDGAGELPGSANGGIVLLSTVQSMAVPDKTYLVVKEDLQEAASALFSDTGVRICTGRKYLGAFIGDDFGKRQYLQSKCEKFSNMVDKISTTAQSEPHAAYSGYVLSLQRKWGYLQHVLNAEDAIFDSLEIAVNTKFVTSLFKGPVETDIRDLTSLPVRMGGMAIEKQNNVVALTYQNSNTLNKVLTEQIMKEVVSLSYEEAQISKADTRRQNNETHERTKLAALKNSGTQLSAMMKYTNEKGANQWLT